MTAGAFARWLSTASLPRRACSTAAIVAVLVLVVPAVASAHPLGNFTINHYDGIRVSPSRIVIDHVLDMAEIPTFSERGDMDTNGNLDVSDAEAAAYEATHCASTRDSLNLEAGGRRLTLVVFETGLSFPQGQGAVTLRLVCEYTAQLASPLPAAGETLTFADSSFAERRGWREVVVIGDGAMISDSDAPETGLTDRLTHYPTDLLSTPSDQRSATWSAAAGGPTLPPLVVPDARPIEAASTAGRPARDPSAPSSPPAAAAGAGPVATTAPAQAVVPGGIGELGSDVTKLFQSEDLTLPAIALSLLVAAGLGALHAVSPGHG
jgi:nickel/cobalt exporter